VKKLILSIFFCFCIGAFSAQVSPGIYYAPKAGWYANPTLKETQFEWSTGLALDIEFKNKGHETTRFGLEVNTGFTRHKGFVYCSEFNEAGMCVKVKRDRWNYWDLLVMPNFQILKKTPTLNINLGLQMSYFSNYDQFVFHPPWHYFLIGGVSKSFVMSEVFNLKIGLRIEQNLRDATPGGAFTENRSIGIALTVTKKKGD